MPIVRLGWGWAVYVGRRQPLVHVPNGLPLGVSGLPGYYVRKRWRFYRRSYALEPSGTLPGEVGPGPIFRFLSMLSVSQSFRGNATRFTERRFEQ